MRDQQDRHVAPDIWSRRCARRISTSATGEDQRGARLVGLEVLLDQAPAARVTLSGCFEGTLRDVAVVAGEDSWEVVILLRLVAVGADLNHVYRIEARGEEGEYDTVSVPADLDPLNSLMASRAFLRRRALRPLLLLDPDAEREDLYLFGHPKSNLGPKQPNRLATLA